jgi:hypothetical protein
MLPALQAMGPPHNFNSEGSERPLALRPCDPCEFPVVSSPVRNGRSRVRDVANRAGRGVRRLHQRPYRN